MSNVSLALVLLENPVTPDMPALAKALRARHPDLPVQTVTDDSHAGARQNPAKSSPLIRCGGELVAVMSMPAPIPQDRGLWSRAASIWPEGRTVAARHRAHLIVSLLGKRSQPLLSARLKTAVIGALIASVPGCCGVVWDCKVARPPELWLEMSDQSFAPFPDFPFGLWVDILPFRSETGIGAFTMGLSAFAEREVQFETEKLPFSAMLERVAGFVAYLVEHGNVIKDGDTVEADGQDRFTVRHKNADEFGGMPVFFCAAD